MTLRDLINSLVQRKLPVTTEAIEAGTNRIIREFKKELIETTAAINNSTAMYKNGRLDNHG